MKQLNFCTGLPRTGSTVLMNILQQHPEIFTTSTDPFPRIVHKGLLVDSRYSEPFQAMSTKQADDAVYGMIMGATQGWYEGLTKKATVISKSRNWAGLHHLYPSSQIIVTVRDLRDIAESFERINEGIKALHSYADDLKMYASMTEPQKYHYHFNSGTALGGSFDELRTFMDIFQRNENKVKFVRYEDFIRAPALVLEKITKFLNCGKYEYDLNNIEQNAVFEHDNAYFREKTSHRTETKFKPWSEPKRTLSPDFHNSVVENHKWYYEAFYPEIIS